MQKVFLCVLALVAFAAASSVVVLTEENFQSSIDSHAIAMVEFYAPWCGHCKKLEPEYDAAAAALSDVAGTVMMGKVDATLEAELAGKFGVRGYPTIKIFRNGVEGSTYDGARTAVAMESYLRRQLQPALTVVTEENSHGFTKSADIVVIANVAKGSADDTVFAALASAQRDHYTFGVVHDASTAAALGLSAGSVKLFRNKDAESYVHSGPVTEADVLAFIKLNSLPLIDAIGPENYNSYVETKLPMGFLFVSLKPADKAARDALLAEYKATAKALLGRAVFVYVDADKYMQHGERLGLSGKVVPAFAVDTPATGGQHWAYDETAPLTAGAMTAFMNSVVDGTLKPTIKSAPVPTSNSGPVTVIVASQFVDKVMDPTKDVFVEFYAPWCGHCKKLEPIFTQLGEAFEDIDSIVIAKMDATANDIPVPGVVVQGFPTIMLFPAGEDKKPVTYEGDRSIADMTQYIVKNAKSHFDPHAVKDVLESVHDEL